MRVHAGAVCGCPRLLGLSAANGRPTYKAPLPHPEAQCLLDAAPCTAFLPGELLLDSLLDGLENAPYRDLCAHALIPFRHGLDRPDLRRRVLDAIDRVTAAHDFARDSLRKLDQLSYALRSTHA